MMKWWILLLLILAGLFIVLPLFVRLVRFFCWTLYFIFCWFSWKPKKKDGNQAGTIKNTEPDAEQAAPNEKNEQDAEQAGTNKNNTKNTIKTELLWLRMQMERTNFWFHLVRNNPRHREQYYFALIAIVGYENWKNVNDTIRMNWESARLSFDRMYGMVKDFAENAEVYAGLFGFDAPAKTSIEEILAPTKEKFEKLHEEMAKLPDKYNAVINNYQEISVNFKKQAEELKQIENSKKQLKECLETLSKLLPPEDKADKK